MNNFWEKLRKNKSGFLVLAPMAGITDIAFREMCANFGADVVYSEMASVNALKYQPKKTLKLISSIENSTPYVVQLFGDDPENFTNAINIITDKNTKEKYSLSNFRIPDGIDINFGCPVPKISKQNAGAELSKDLGLSKKIIKACVASTDLPVSIKLRSSVGHNDALEFLENVKDVDIKAVIIHGRDIKQMHKGEVNYELIKKARNFFGGVIVGNGGVNNLETYHEMLSKSQADGVAIGQGTYGRPWIFEDIKKENSQEKNQHYRLKTAWKHAQLASKHKGERGIIEMRKHLCWYVQGLPSAKSLREKFVQVNTLEDIEEIIFNI